jgi:hypothetical protein
MFELILAHLTSSDGIFLGVIGVGALAWYGYQMGEKDKLEEIERKYDLMREEERERREREENIEQFNKYLDCTTPEERRNGPEWNKEDIAEFLRNKDKES